MAKDSRCVIRLFCFCHIALSLFHYSVIASIRDGVFPSPRSTKSSPRDANINVLEKVESTSYSHGANVSPIEESPSKSDTSLSSDSVSYHLKLRPAPQELAHSNESSKHRFISHHDSVNVAKGRLQREPQPHQKLGLRQVRSLQFSCHHHLFSFFQKDNEDEEDSGASQFMRKQQGSGSKVDPAEIVSFSANAANEQPHPDSVDANAAGDGLYESQGSLDSQSKRAFAVSFAGVHLFVCLR
jgi:hypothetical protein